MGNGKKLNKKVRRAPAIYYTPDTKTRRESNFNWGAFWTIFKLAVPSLTLIYVFYYSPVFKLKEVVVSGNEFLAKEELLSLVPSGMNIFKLSTTELEYELQRKLPIIQEVRIYKGIPNALKVVVSEYKGAAIWQSGEKYYLISQTGIVFRDITSNLEEYVSLPRVVDRQALEVKISEKIVSTNFITFIEKISQGLKTETNLDPDYFAVDETTVDVSLYTKNALYIKLDSLRSPDKQLSDLKLAIIERRPEITEYIDLRISGWAYYK